MKKSVCRISGAQLTEVVDFGKQPLGNGFIEASHLTQEYFYTMKIGFCEESMMLQLLDQPEPKKMFHDQYAFYSSTSTRMAGHFEEFAKEVIDSKYLSKDHPFVVEMGCNDGIMLKHFARAGINHLGIEPSLNVAQEANNYGVRTISEFFCAQIAHKIVEEYGLADAFLAANVMCHIGNIRDIVKGIKILLKPNGVVIFEDPYLGDIIKKTSYDQIYDEHVFLFSALSIQNLFEREGFELIKVQHQNTHGGSMRYILSHKGAYNVENSVYEILSTERAQGLDKLITFKNFNESVKKSKKDLIALLKDLKSQGKRVVGYGATSKSTTILNYCGVGVDLISYICDTTPIKQGKLSPGAHIPVVSYDDFKKTPPDYAFLFAWNHSVEIMAKENEFKKNGGKWITHVPEVKIF
jgi:SAM-dependent methyltransferase